LRTRSLLRCCPERGLLVVRDGPRSEIFTADPEVFRNGRLPVLTLVSLRSMSARLTCSLNSMAKLWAKRRRTPADHLADRQRGAVFRG
jgi:hypothetical protein